MGEEKKVDIFGINSPEYRYAKTQQEKLNKKKERPKKYNKSPEELIVKEILYKLKSEGFSVNRYESKAKCIMTKDGPRWLNSGLKFGTPDIMGCCSNGYGVYIEVKDVGKRVKSCLREDQRNFLLEKIKHNAFAVCTDSVNHLLATYYKWISLSKEDRIRFLMEDLP